jgi:hypothetical protein
VAEKGRLGFSGRKTVLMSVAALALVGFAMAVASAASSATSPTITFVSPSPAEGATLERSAREGGASGRTIGSHGRLAFVEEQRSRLGLLLVVQGERLVGDGETTALWPMRSPAASAPA